MGIQDASRKVQGSSREPVTWAGTTTTTTEEVYGLVSEDIWDKAKRLIRELVDMGVGMKEEKNRENMEYIILF